MGTKAAEDGEYFRSFIKCQGVIKGRLGKAVVLAYLLSIFRASILFTTFLFTPWRTSLLPQSERFYIDFL